MSKRIRIKDAGDDSVSGLLDVPARASSVVVLAHGAGAGMAHPFMAETAALLAARGCIILRYQFPYMEKGRRRVDAPAVAHRAVRATVADAARRFPGLPLFAGGKSFGGRMTSQAQALEPLPGVSGLFFLGFPLHPAGRPSVDRAHHLRDIDVPMLFLQGTRDALADERLISSVVKKLGRRSSIHRLEGADHAFHVLVRSGRTDAAVHEELIETLASWIARCSRAPSRSRR